MRWREAFSIEASRVRGLTRNPQKPEAQALADHGAEVVQGDMEDRSSMERALEGAYGIFSVQNFWETGYDGEVQQGKTVADAAKAGVEHFVYSSVGSAHRQTGIPHFESKWEVEEHVRLIGLPYTILRPAFLMQNWEWMREMILGGTLAQPLDPDKPFQQVAVEDIGAFAAIAFENPGSLDRTRGRSCRGRTEYDRDSRYVQPRHRGEVSYSGALGPVRGADGRRGHRQLPVDQRRRL